MLPIFAAAGGGGPVSHFSGTISKYVTGAVACTVTATFETDGTVTGSESGPAGTFSNGASGDKWSAPTLICMNPYSLSLHDALPIRRLTGFFLDCARVMLPLLRSQAEAG